MDASTRDMVGGRYRLEDRLARGGMGEVWRAHDTHTGRTVAVKVLHETAGASASRRLRREARMVASLIHPNIVTVLDVIDDAATDDVAGHDNPAIVMELVEGETLADRLAREGLLPLNEALRVADAVLAALEAAHARDIVHRDVTPANVLLASDGAIKVTDFGIARSPTQTRLTDTGTIVGTAPYLSPEQLLDEPPTHASDQYSAGVVIYEALSGSRPFEGESPASVAVARLHTDPVPLRSRRPEVPEGVAAVVERALSRPARERFASASEMRVAIHMAGGDATAPTTPQAGVAPLTVPIETVPIETVPIETESIETVPIETAPLHTTSALDAPPAPPAPAPDPSEQRRSRVPVALAVLAAFLLAAVLGAALRQIASDSGAAVSVPRLVGSDLEAARNLAERSGFELAVEEVADSAPEGTILSQNVAEGTEVVVGTTIGVEVSSGEAPCCTVPRVVGLSLDDASKVIDGENLRVGDVERVDAEIEEGTVLAQEPVSGTDLDPGSTVDLMVSGKGDDDDDDDDRENRGRGRG